jgi:hypothetical protein
MLGFLKKKVGDRVIKNDADVSYSPDMEGMVFSHAELIENNRELANQVEAQSSQLETFQLELENAYLAEQNFKNEFYIF